MSCYILGVRRKYIINDKTLNGFDVQRDCDSDHNSIIRKITLNRDMAGPY